MTFAGRHMMRYGFDADEIRLCLPRLVEAGALVVVVADPDPVNAVYRLVSEGGDDDE